MKALRRMLLLSLVVPFAFAAAFRSGALPAQSGDYPARPARVIVPFSAGGLGDTVARGVAQHLSEKLGQPFVVDNRPGASEIIATELVAKSPADGYTLLQLTAVGTVFNPITKKNLSYDPLRDLAPVALLFESPFYLVVNPQVQATSVRELIALARANPGKLSFASIGSGSLQHLLAEMFKARANLDLLHVPYKASGPAEVDLVAGRIDLMFQGGGGTLNHLRSGKLRGLAATSANRAAQAPSLPTMIESGFGDFNAVSWFGIFAPAGVPRPIIERLNREIGDYMKSPEARSRFAPQGIEVVHTTPEGLTERIRREGPFWTRVIRDAGIQPE
ncbi:MAG: tripartite tricarboxylate transporter substrate binding protein [Betaproteobacteria bacterium]|nr:tripartite tricarboxylate transporter substrate binding protein [Betaproteobacteria bacterium]